MSDLEGENYCRSPTENPDIRPGFVTQKPEPLTGRDLAHAAICAALRDERCGFAVQAGTHTATFAAFLDAVTEAVTKAREDALDDAAKAASALAKDYADYETTSNWEGGYCAGASDVSRAIRALKEKEQ